MGLAGAAELVADEPVVSVEILTSLVLEGAATLMVVSLVEALLAEALLFWGLTLEVLVVAAVVWSAAKFPEAGQH